MRMRTIAAALLITAAAGAGCGAQTESEESGVPEGAIPAAPDMRPETGPATGGTVLPGSEAAPRDTVAGDRQPLPTDTLPAQTPPR